MRLGILFEKIAGAGKIFLRFFVFPAGKNRFSCTLSGVMTPFFSFCRKSRKNLVSSEINRNFFEPSKKICHSQITRIFSCNSCIRCHSNQFKKENGVITPKCLQEKCRKNFFGAGKSAGNAGKTYGAKKPPALQAVKSYSASTSLTFSNMLFLTRSFVYIAPLSSSLRRRRSNSSFFLKGRVSAG